MLNGNTGLATYIPAANYNGPDSFQYAASDGSTQSEPKAVTLSVSPVNDAPIATNQIVKTLRNRTVDFELTATDVENNSLTVFNPTAITSGILYYMGGKKYSYRPNVGFVGEASFSYMASDGQLSSNFATVRILVEDLGSTFTYEPDYDVNSNQTVTTTLFVPEAPAGRAPVLVIDTLAQISCNVADVNCYAGYSLKLVAPDGTAVYNWVTVQGLGGVASANLTITEGEDRFGLDIFATQNAVKLVNTPAGNWTLTLSADGRTRFSIRSWKVILKPVP